MAAQAYLQRIKDLFKDLESLESDPGSRSKAIRGELEALKGRLQQLEAEFLERVQEASDKESLPPTRPQSPIIYEKDRVGYAFRDDRVNPIQAQQAPKLSPENSVNIPLLAAGTPIGGIQIQQPAERPLSPDQMDLATDVVKQVAQQIQNLRLLAATERARAEAEASTRRFVHEGWASYLDAIHQNERIGYCYDRESVAPFSEKLHANSGFVQPLVVTDEQVGALYLQPEASQPLSDDDKQLVAAVGRQLAQQVENLRLLADAARARAQAEEATRQLTRESWTAYTDQHTGAKLAFKYDTSRVSRFDEADMPADVVFRQPLVVRGETVGHLAVAGLDHVSPDSMQLAASIAAQTSVHLETLRLSEQNEKRAHEMEAVAELSATTSTVLDPDNLLQTIVDLTKERFGLYHAQVYLANDSWRTLLLAAGAGEVGRQLVAQEHAIGFDDEPALVAQAARQRKALIVNDVRGDPGYLPSSLLPNTRAEMLVPMVVGDKLLGVFDVQSDREPGFSDEDAGIYATLASQAAVALQNARLYVEQAATVTQLRELDRLKSSFLANMSHELRTPLNSILGFADVILAELDGPLTENMSTDLQLIQKNGQHLLHLINDVLDMAKIEAGRMNLSPEKFTVKDVLDEVVSITSTLASHKQIELFVAEDSDASIALVADRTRIRQVMINLVNNAIKFTEKGRVWIEAHMQGRAAALIAVRDTGIGIPPDKLDTVFQEFAQVDTSTTRKAGGTGLGLPISRRLVEMHGGKLWAESTGIAGEGSAFYVELPLVAQMAEPVEQLEKQHEPA